MYVFWICELKHKMRLMFTKKADEISYFSMEIQYFNLFKMPVIIQCIVCYIMILYYELLQLYYIYTVKFYYNIILITSSECEYSQTI